MAKTLNSWKEIAAYFGVTARTAQDWEKTGGLPVHRWPKGARPRVFTDPDELDAWRQSSESLGQGRKPTMGGAARSALLKTRVGYILGLIGLFGILGLVFWYFNWRPGQPSHARMEGLLLRVFDDSGRLCWEHEFPELYQEKYRVQTFPWNGDPRNEFIHVADIDGDNKNETLIRYIPANLETGDTLFCFDSDGSVRWNSNTVVKLRYVVRNS